jgi:hypothetical protein
MKTKIVSLSPSIELALTNGKFSVERVISACNSTLGEFQLDTPGKAKRGVLTYQSKVAKVSENEGTSKYIGNHSAPAKFIAFNDKVASVEKMLGDECTIDLGSFPEQFGQWLNNFQEDTIARRKAEKDAEKKKVESQSVVTV